MAHDIKLVVHNVGSETGFQRVLEWFRDVYTIQECSIPDSRTESERILTSSNMTFLDREIRRIRRLSVACWAARRGSGCQRPRRVRRAVAGAHVAMPTWMYYLLLTSIY